MTKNIVQATHLPSPVIRQRSMWERQSSPMKAAGWLAIYINIWIQIYWCKYIWKIYEDGSWAGNVYKYIWPTYWCKYIRQTYEGCRWAGNANKYMKHWKIFVVISPPKCCSFHHMQLTVLRTLEWMWIPASSLWPSQAFTRYQCKYGMFAKLPGKMYLIFCSIPSHYLQITFTGFFRSKNGHMVSSIHLTGWQHVIFSLEYKHVPWLKRTCNLTWRTYNLTWQDDTM